MQINEPFITNLKSIEAINGHIAAVRWMIKRKQRPARKEELRGWYTILAKLKQRRSEVKADAR
jgi:hypothetical protein